MRVFRVLSARAAQRSARALATRATAVQRPGRPARTLGRAPPAQRARALSYPAHEVVGLPALSPTMEVGTIAKWHVVEGGSFGAGDSICEIETDKASMDFEAQDDGVVAKHLQPAGAEVAVGVPILVVVEDAADAGAFADFEAPAEEAPAAPVPAPAAAGPAANPAARLMPAARHMSHSRGIDVTGLAGSGKGGLITKGDVLEALAAGTTFPALGAAAAPAAAPTAAASGAAAQQEPFQPLPRVAFDPSTIPTTGAPYTDEPATTMRKVIAKRLTESRAFVPHAFASVEADLAGVAKLRKHLLSEFGVKVSVNDVVIKAVALALRDVPRANSSWDGATCQPNASIDISVAVATPAGLITPIVFDAAGKGLSVISSEVRDLATRAKLGKLKPEEFQGGTFTVSNLGMFGITEFSAVVNPPQACILAVGGGVPRLVPDGDSAREITTMTSRLSSDRRVVDEPTAARFLQAFQHYVAHPELLSV